LRLVAIALGLVVAGSVVAGCGGIPNGRYGVENVSIHGATRMDEEAIEACLGTRERGRARLDIGIRGTPECGEGPFDGDHVMVNLWSWPWEDWPLFDESVFERDVERIERWYRARGFYNARVIATEVVPSSAASERTEGEGCGAGPDTDCSVDVSFTVEEGEPVLVETVAMRGYESLPDGTRQRLRNVLLFSDGDRFDEAALEDTKTAMLRLLHDTGYADAEVRGRVKINQERREAFVVFEITPGQPSVIGRVCVTGFGDLPAQSMLDVAALDAGSEYSLATLESAQRALYSLGVFSGVEVNAVPPPEEEEPEDPVEEEEPQGPPVVDPEDVSVGTVEPEPRVCGAMPTNIPAGHRAVDILIHVTPGRITRVGFGVGLQAGQAVTFGTVASFSEQTDAAQWDYHVSFSVEHRNLFDRLIRARLEVRPRAIFQMPVFNHTPVDPIPFGVQANLTLRWPAFLEPRTNLLTEIRYDLGPMPFTGFYRSDLTWKLGPERWFFDNVLYGGFFLNANWFLPTDRQPVALDDQLPETAAVWLEEVLTLDLRDDPRNPHAGAYFAIASQQGVQPLGSWDFVRFTAEGRGYIPVADTGVVIAMRFEIGIMQVFGSSISDTNVYQYQQLGPPSLQLRGGGASSNRGYAAGLMGDVEQIYVTLPRVPDQVAVGTPIGARPVRITGGTWLWEGSLEVRIPITLDLGVVFFADAGDVNRDAVSIVGPDGDIWRFDHPQFAFGFGLRYRTIIGPLRFDVGIRPDELAAPGAQSSLPPACTNESANRCRPLNYVDIFGLQFPGAFHLTIGEAF
jgi:outer membrane translocation and assembly module TamA